MTPKIVVHGTEKLPNHDDAHSKYNLYGWRNFRIGGLLSRPVFAYIILCTCNFIQNFSVNGANNAVISTLERVFYMDSVQSGLFLALYDVATVFSSPIVGYLGTRYSSPIFFSLNMIIIGFGNIMIASSNFVNQGKMFNLNADFLDYLATYDDVLYQCDKDPFNSMNVTDLSCLKQERLTSASQSAKLVLYFGNFVNGIGSVALFTIGIAYIERIFPRDKAAYCQGIYFAVGTVGGALGIIVTGRFLSIFTKLTPRKKLPSWLTPSNPLWIGCWWLPYYIYGSLSFLVGLFVSGLPNYEIPGKKHEHIDTLVQASSDDKDAKTTNPSLVREESMTSISMLSSCSPTPALSKDLSGLDSDSKNQSKDVATSLRPPSDEYRLSNRKFRQLSPLLEKSASNASLTVNNTEGFINPAYSTESLHNQLPDTDSTPSAPPPTITTNSTSFAPPPAPSINTDPTPLTPPSTTTVSPNPQIPQRTISERLRQMWFLIRELMKNTRYVCIVIAGLSEGILIKGFVPFISTYFQYQHQLNISTATLVTGAVALFSVIIGCPIGAYFINKFSWTPMQCARVCGIVFTVSAFLFLFLVLSCPELKFEYSACTTSNIPCCHNIYHPVCLISDPKKMFLSPCHYGCTNQTISSNGSINYYSSCNCADDPSVTLSESACRFRAIPCVVIFALTLTGATFVVFFTAFVQVPMLQVLLYSIPLPYQSMALGIRQTIVRVLGETTGPLLFGFVFDQSCLVWLVDCFGQRTCAVYNNRRMGLSMALSGFSTRIISGISCIIVFFNWKFKHSDEVINSPKPVTITTDDPIKKSENGQVND